MVGLHGMTWTWKGTMRLEYLVMRVSGSMHQQSRGSRAVPGADCREASGWTVHELLVKAKDPANADADSFLFFPSLPWIHYNYATFTYSIISVYRPKFGLGSSRKTCSIVLVWLCFVFGDCFMQRDDQMIPSYSHSLIEFFYFTT